jgi:hypothetical protein
MFRNYILWNHLCGLELRVPGYRSRGSGFDSRHYQIFWEVVGLELGPLNLVSTTEELLERKGSGSGLESRDYSCREPPRWLLDISLSEKVDTNFDDKRLSFGQYSSLSRTKATELFFFLFLYVMDVVMLK